MSLDNQRNLKLAFHRDPMFVAAAEQVAEEMNAWAVDFLGRRIVNDWRQQLDFTTRIFRPRGLHLDDRHIQHESGHGFSASIADVALYIVNNHERMRGVGSSLVLYLPKIQTAAEAALWNDILGSLEMHLVAARGNDQDLRAGRTDRSFVPADGDSRRAAHAIRRLQHRTVGLHQQRVGRAGLGSRVRQSQHRRDHDDLRLHAPLRGSRAPRREHAGRARAHRPLAGRHGAEHSGRVAGGRGRRDGSSDRRRRARTAGGRQRQMGRPLEDGPHRPAGLGKARQGEPARQAIPRADLYRRGCGGAARAGARAANRARRPRSDQRGAAVRQRLRSGTPGGGAEAGGFLRQ